MDIYLGMIGLASVSDRVKTVRLLETVGVLILVAMIYLVMRFWARAAKWKSEGLFSRPLQNGGPLVISEKTSDEGEAESGKGALTAGPDEVEALKMSRNRKD